MHLRNAVLLAGALSGGLALSAAGQTGRIALASHAGSIRAGSDNLGLPEFINQFQVDSIVCVNDTLAMEYGRMRRVPYLQEPAASKVRWQQVANKVTYYQPRYGQQSWQEAVTALQQQFSGVKLVGFDKQLQKRSRKKPSGYLQAFPKRPFQYSYWHGLATVAALGAVGWLLGRKSQNL